MGKLVLLTILCIFLAAGPAARDGNAASEDKDQVRKPAVAGMFYPGNPEELQKTVTDSLHAARKEPFAEPIKAILSPHAGLTYCGATMAAAFKQIEGAAFTYDTVILIGLSHRVPTKAAAVSSASAWETPLGKVDVDTALTAKLTRMSDRVEFNDRAHAQEHSLEVLLPFLHVASGGKPFKIVPLLTSSSDPQDQQIVAGCLTEIAGDPRILIVLSADLSHFPPGPVAQIVDGKILDAVKSLDPKRLSEQNALLMKEGHPGLECTICALDATMCVLRAAEGLGIKRATVLNYSNSGMTSGDENRVVGYGAVVFTSTGKSSENSEATPMTVSFSEESRRELLAIARAAVKAAVAGERTPASRSENPELQIKSGCFVTLHNKGMLRGCIGTFTANDALWQTVHDVAVSSAVRDVRFAGNPVTPAEVPELDVEISVLSPLRTVSDPLREIRLGRDGIIIHDGGRSGTFLPQVATETGWSLEEFLGHCARDKAGLGWDGWRSPSARVYAYTVTIVSEKDEAASARK
jgi:MEMO1 family protein